MGTQKYTTVKGMDDVKPPESLIWNSIEERAREVFSAFNCIEIRTPIVEKTELFVRSIGESTAVVEKEMYTFLDRNNDSLSLRPEGTASVVRSYIDGHGGDDQLAKYYYMGPMFRYERPQKGRKRQFHQIGVEIIGATHPASDAEVMATFKHFMDVLGVNEYALEINSIGCKKCRPEYNKKFLKFLNEKSSLLCQDCTRRIVKNPLRAFDCKIDTCRAAMEDAPLIGAHLCEECKGHFDGVQRFLEVLKIPYRVNHRIVRGLDYYVRTAFEFTTDRLGAQNAICAGGRYDGLVKAMGGPDVAGVGYSMGVERILLLLETLNKLPKVGHDLVYFALLGADIVEKTIPMIDMLRADGVNVEWDYETKSLKSQMRRADRLRAHTVVIIGEEELRNGVAIVRNMHTKEQQEIKMEGLMRHFVHVEV